ncbi:MAG: AMP-binding protein [Polyangiaceae bacterium]|nr:AMP-binding protein [Polyangiaceae bacterium]
MALHGLRSPWRRRVRAARASVRNALEVVQLGRMAPTRGHPYEVVERDRTHRLRRYAPAGTVTAGPLLLVPPLMLTAEIYDVAPDLSAVVQLVERGVDVWVCDFGAPEREEGGMDRTLDDHVRAVASCVRRVRAATGRDVHLAGYSQGGMFAYQTAAYLRSEGLRSVIAFGSPVDIHLNLPLLRQDAAAQVIRAGVAAAEPILRRLEGLPGELTSTGFKLLSVRKEAEQFLEFLGKLHDRQALEKQAARRRFLAGEGFVAWPGPALREFVEQVVIQNRMASGGFVIDGRAITLADITCPVLCFVGMRDEIARPASVRAIRRAAPAAEVSEVPLEAGHFGLVVGRTASRLTWPCVVEWLRWREGTGPTPDLVERAARPTRQRSDEVEVEDAAFDEPLELELFYDAATDAVRAAWDKVSNATRDFGDAIDGVRWQAPRLTKLERLNDHTRVSFSRSLAEQARANPERTFFLWKGRAFTYADSDRRVNAIVKGLLHVGVGPAQRVGVLMRGRPTYLSVVTALNRVGACAVLIPPHLEAARLARAFELTGIERLIVDPESLPAARAAGRDEALVLGGGGGGQRDLGAGAFDLEALDVEKLTVPKWHVPDIGRARDVTMMVVSVTADGKVRAARITNGRWAFSALGAAAACTLTPKDTVYCCLPLHHPAGLLVSVGAALVGGARLALGARFDESTFFPEVRRYGATVAFYAGTMCRRLVNAPPAPGDRTHPLRLFAGSGIRPDVCEKLRERFGNVGVLEFYASTEGNVVLANASGEKPAGLGRPLPGSAEIAVARWDPERRDLERDARGLARRVASDEPGVLLARVDETHTPPLADLGGDGTTRVKESVFEPGDAWYVTGDLVARDADGDHRLVERAADLVPTPAGWVAPRKVEDALYQRAEVAFACVFGVPARDRQVPMAAVVLLPGRALDRWALVEHLERRLAPHELPVVVRFLEALPVNEGFRPLREPLRTAGARAPGIAPSLVWIAGRREYVPLDEPSLRLAGVAEAPAGR